MTSLASMALRPCCQKSIFREKAMSEANTLFEIDRELDSLLDQIEEET
jgi:hypothetical protein